MITIQMITILMKMLHYTLVWIYGIVIHYKVIYIYKQNAYNVKLLTLDDLIIIIIYLA